MRTLADGKDHGAIELLLHADLQLAGIAASTDFLPPEKPANKWGSMKPCASSRSAAAATRLMMHSPPEGPESRLASAL